MCKEFLTFDAHELNLSHQIWVGFIFVYQKSLKWTFKTSFWVQNHLLNLCSSAVNSQRLMYSQKAGVKCSYQSWCEIFVSKLSGIIYIYFFKGKY